jgi:hypothetical protein
MMKFLNPTGYAVSCSGRSGTALPRSRSASVSRCACRLELSFHLVELLTLDLEEPFAELVDEEQVGPPVG